MIEFIEAKDEDLKTILEIYNYYLENTTATFDCDRIIMEEFKKRVFVNNDKYKTFLAYIDGEMIGFCFLTRFRKNPAYDKTVELGLYLKPRFTGKGLGAKMINYLEKVAKENNFEMLIASISGENLPSINLFRKLGYSQCAHYREVASKFGRKLDLVDLQKPIRRSN